MAGRGPAPKDPRRRARTNSDPVPVRVFETSPVPQPPLDEVLGEANPATGAPWSSQTLKLWRTIGVLPQTQGLVDAQWAVLARAMILDDLVIAGDVKHAAEARLQLSKFFISPDDMLRGRIVTAQADEADAKRPAKAGPAADKFGALKAAG